MWGRREVQRVEGDESVEGVEKAEFAQSIQFLKLKEVLVYFSEKRRK